MLPSICLNFNRLNIKMLKIERRMELCANKVVVLHKGNDYPFGNFFGEQSCREIVTTGTDENLFDECFSTAIS